MFVNSQWAFFLEKTKRSRKEKKSESKKEPRTNVIFEIPKEVSWDTC